MLLNTLGTTSESQLSLDFLKSLCQCLASIGVVEIPTGDWPEYVKIMSDQAMQNEHRLFKLAGIMSLGNLLDQLKPEDFSSDDIENMWGSMVSNIDLQNKDLSRIVAGAILQLAPTC